MLKGLIVLAQNNKTSLAATLKFVQAKRLSCRENAIDIRPLEVPPVEDEVEDEE